MALGKNHQPLPGACDRPGSQQLSTIMKTSYISSISLRGFLMRNLLPILAALSLGGNSFAATVNLAWDPSASSNVGGYKISYGTSSGNYTATIDAGKKTKHSVTGLKDGTKYYFAVKAYDSAKTLESAYSNQLAVSVPAKTAPKSTPINVSITGGAKSETTSGTTGGATKVAAGGTAGAVTSGTKQANGAGLVAAYGFEEGSGKKVVDASGKGNHGIIKGAVRIDKGRYGKALKFDGKNDWVTVKNDASLDLSNGMTLEAWVYPLSQTKGNNAVIVKRKPKGEAYALFSEEDANLPAAYIHDGKYHGVSSRSRLPAKTWSHLVATYDGYHQKLYVNGALAATSAKKTLIKSSKGMLRIGGIQAGGENFHGYIDEVRIYNRALTPGEVNADKAASINASNPSQYVMGDKKLEPWVEYRPEGTAEAFQSTAAKSRILTNVRVYVDASSTAKELHVGIYKNKKSGHPSRLVAEGKLANPKAGAWNTVPISAVSVIEGRPYWIALLGLQGQIAFRDQVGSSAGVMETSASGKLKKLPKNWKKGSATQPKAAMSIYGRGY
jgi:hypothetical protein